MRVTVSECVSTVCSWAPPLPGFPILVDRDGNSTMEVQFLALSLEVTAKSPLAAFPMHDQPKDTLSLQAHRRLRLHLSHPETN